MRPIQNDVSILCDGTHLGRLNSLDIDSMLVESYSLGDCKMAIQMQGWISPQNTPSKFTPLVHNGIYFAEIHPRLSLCLSECED